MGEGSSVVLVSSNSVTCQPGWKADVTAACLADDEEKARRLASNEDAVNIYPATKAALAYWARREGIKPEWAGAGIRVNAVAPGMIATPMTEQLRNDPQLGVFADAYPTALNRPGRPEEIAALVAFLLSAESSLLVGSGRLRRRWHRRPAPPARARGDGRAQARARRDDALSSAVTKVRAAAQAADGPPLNPSSRSAPRIPGAETGPAQQSGDGAGYPWQFLSWVRLCPLLALCSDRPWPGHRRSRRRAREAGRRCR